MVLKTSRLLKETEKRNKKVNVCSKYFSTDFSGLRLRRETFGRAFSWTFSRVSGRTVVGGACVFSGAEKKAFDRGGPVWPPRSNAADDRLGGDTSYYNVWSPSPSRPAGGKSPDDQKHDLNLTDLT